MAARGVALGITLAGLLSPHGAGALESNPPPPLQPAQVTAALSASALSAVLTGRPPAAGPGVKTLCAITINSADEKESFQRHLPRDQYRVVELVQRGRSDWLDAACRSGVKCDALIISGHFDDGSEFYADQSDFREYLTVRQMQQATCSDSCTGLFSQLKEVYLFGCKTLGSEPRLTAAGEVRRSLQRAGRSAEEAERIAAQLGERYGQSNRDRIRQIFKDVPLIYGFASQAPLGRYAGPLMDRYFQSAPAGEVASGRTSATLLNLFAPVSMVSTAGLTDADAHAPLRRDLCSLADQRTAAADKVAFVHQLLQRDAAEVRMLLNQLEDFLGGLGPREQVDPAVGTALTAITQDRSARDRFLDFARDADEAEVQARMFTLAQRLGWLTPAEERSEFVHLLAGRMQRGTLGRHEVDLVCRRHREPQPDLLAQLRATGAPQPGVTAHAAVLACLGDAEAHQRSVRALTSARAADALVAQVYLRHRSLADTAEVRALATDIARMGPGPGQLRALETLARQRLADPQSVQEIARLFPQARNLELQRAIAGILLRADTRSLARADLARSLRLHRLKAPDGGSDVIDMLIRVLQTG